MLALLFERWWTYWTVWHLHVTLCNLTVVIVCICLFCPTMVAHWIFYPFFRLVFGTLYPAYASYKAVRTKNVKEYVKWMMYWIVFALFTCAETFTDVFFSFWFPLYYEFKVILVLWLLSPATKGSSILYRKFVHPMLTQREQEIDDYISRAKEQGYHTVLSLGTKGVNYATSVIMQTAIKNLNLAALGTSSLISNTLQQPLIPPTGEPKQHRVNQEAKILDEGDGSVNDTSTSYLELMEPLDMYSDEDEMKIANVPAKRTRNATKAKGKKTKAAKKTVIDYDSDC